MKGIQMFPHWTEDFINVSGSRFHYTRTGQGSSKPVLVLAHGFSDHGLCWLPVARDLESEWDVIMPDARGHGRSERVQRGENVDLAGDLAGFISAMVLNQPVVGGHSMGASTTSQMDGRFPGVARALVLEDPAWFEFPPRPVGGDEGEEKQKRDAFGIWLQGLGAARIEDLMAKCHAENPTWPEVELHPWAESKLQFDTNFLFTSRPNLAEVNWEKEVEGLRAPTLLITADPARGAIVTPESAAKARAISSLIQVANISGAGHSIRREGYPAFMAAVRSFLNRLA
jgi:N-formylmaleamate deformylase